MISQPVYQAQQMVFSFMAEDAEAVEDDLLSPNCWHGRLRYSPGAACCRECGIPYGTAGLYWPAETMPELKP